MHDDTNAGDPCVDSARIIEWEDPVLEAKAGRLLLHRLGVPTGEDGAQPAFQGSFDDELAGIAVRPVMSAPGDVVTRS